MLKIKVVKKIGSIVVSTYKNKLHRRLKNYVAGMSENNSALELSSWFWSRNFVLMTSLILEGAVL